MRRKWFEIIKMCISKFWDATPILFIAFIIIYPAFSDFMSADKDEPPTESITYSDEDEAYVDELLEDYEENLKQDEYERKAQEAYEEYQDNYIEENFSDYEDFQNGTGKYQKVYIAPYSGQRYHFSSKCKGLESANSIEELGLQEAKDQGYTICGFEK